MEFADAKRGFTYLSPQDGRPATSFSWSISLRAEEGGRALLWFDGPIPDVIEVDAGHCLMTAIMEAVAVRQMEQQ